MRFNPLPREKTTIIKLRKLGYSINHISNFLGRSTSFVFRALSFNYGLILRKIDLRKLPCYYKHLSASTRVKIMEKYYPLWQDFILGLEDKPP